MSDEIRINFDLANQVLNIIKDLLYIINLLSRLIFEIANLIGVLLGL